MWVNVKNGDETLYEKYLVAYPKSKIVSDICVRVCVCLMGLIQLVIVATLSDYQVRDLNDYINKMMREKHHWEKRIRQLGGPNYSVSVHC